MSDSDSQQQQHFNLKKLPQEQQPHIKEILQKGKKILPSYDDQSLYGLFKRYYCVENIFLNELHIIAKRAKGDHDSDDRKKDQKWIKVGREVKTKVNKTKYNFLEDKQLLRRAEQYLKNKKLAPERRQNFGERKDVERRPQTRKRQNYEQPPGSYINRSAQNQRPKQKFVEKVQEVKKQTQPIVQQEKKVQTKKKESPVKEQKYKQKVQPTTKVEPTKPQQKTVQQQPKQPQPKQQKTQAQHHPSKHEEKKHQPSHHEPQKQQTHKKQQNVKQPHHPVKSTHHEQKKTHQNHHEKQHPAKKETVSHHEKQPATQPAKESSTHSIPTVQNFDPVVAGENFKQACNQNSFVLKFIQPQAYPQRISYVRTADGGMKNVQIRVTGTSNQGSQKAL